ncbi:MAG: pitrilysin family protein, partial [Pseudomonadota bacterium]
MTVRIDTLPNGLRVATEDMPGLGSAALGVWIGAGGRHEAEGENGVAHFLEHMAFKGTARRSALDIAVEIENVGGYLNAYTSREATAYYARVLSEDAPLALDLLADILTAPRFAAEDIVSERGVILQEIGQSLDTPDDIVFDWLQEAAYPGQAFGRSILGAAEGVKALGETDLRRFIGAHYAPERMVVAAAGAVDHEKILRQAETLFGHLTRRDAPALAPASFRGGEHRAEKPLEQAHFTLALEAPNWHADDLHAGQVFATLLGGGMSSRLFQEAREVRGLCYSIFAQASAHEDTGLLTVYAGTGADEIKGLAELVADEIARAASAATEEETARARAQLRAGLMMGLESPFGRCERLARQLLIWGRAAPAEETSARIEAVDAAAARAAGQRMAGGGRRRRRHGTVKRLRQAPA